MNFYPFHIGDFNNATRHLTRLERCMYREMLDLYYDSEKPLSTDVEHVLNRRLIAVTPEEQQAVKDVLNEFFSLDENGYRNARCDAELEKFYKMRDAKSRAGKASARSKLNTCSTRVEQTLNTCSTERQQPLPLPLPLPLPKEEKTKQKRFVIPSIDEVSAYCVDRRNTVDPQKFMDHYNSNGWRVGKNPMKDWQAAIRTWEKNSLPSFPGAKPAKRELTKEEKERETFLYNAWLAHEAKRLGMTVEVMGQGNNDANARRHYPEGWDGVTEVPL